MEDLAVLDEEHAGGVARRAHGVGDHEQRLPAPVDLVKEREQLLGGAGIERAGRLVGEDELRAGDQRAGDGDALLLAAGDLVGILAQQRFDAQPPRKRGEFGLHVGKALTGEHEGQEDVVADGEGIQQVELLEHEAEVLAAEGGHLALAHGGHVPPGEQHLAAGGRIESGEDVEQGGLAGAGLAHDGDELALVHGEIDVAQRLDAVAAQARGVDLFEVLDFENGHVCVPPCVDRGIIAKRGNGKPSLWLTFPRESLQFCKVSSLMPREAEKGQGAKPLAGFGAAPQAGFRPAALTLPIAKRSKKKQSGSEARPDGGVARGLF